MTAAILHEVEEFLAAKLPQLGCRVLQKGDHLALRYQIDAWPRCVEDSRSPRGRVDYPAAERRWAAAKIDAAASIKAQLRARWPRRWKTITCCVEDNR